MPHPEPIALRTTDAVRLDGVHLPSASGLAIVLAHGFSGSWSHERTRRVAAALNRYGGVVGFDFRGHGRSGGMSTVGDLEVLDVAAAVEFARSRGYERVAVVGFSMGASVAVRHAGLYGGVDAVVAISAVAHWYYRGTRSMRLLHRAIETVSGRAYARYALRTRISPVGWDPVPSTPEAAAAKIAPTPLLLVHGDADGFFPLRHVHALYDSANEPKQLWIEKGMGHATAGTSPGLVARVGDWLSNSTTTPPVSPAA